MKTDYERLNKSIVRRFSVLMDEAISQIPNNNSELAQQDKADLMHSYAQLLADIKALTEG